MTDTQPYPIHAHPRRMIASGELISRYVAASRLRGALVQLRGLLRRHWLFLILFALSVAVRIGVALAYWPALYLAGDSYDYLLSARTLQPSGWHPAVYPLLLRLLSTTQNIGAVTVLQHIMGVALGAVIYAFLTRLGLRPWLAALGAAPVLLDAYQVEIEQYLLAETLTAVLVVLALLILLSCRRIAAPRAAAVGLLLALAALTRTAALPLLVLVCLYLLLYRHWRAVPPFLLSAGVVLASYAGWYFSVYGHPGFSGYTGYFLYGRVAPFATCAYPLPRAERVLCPRQPLARRTFDQDFYVFLPKSPLNQPGLGSWSTRNNLAETFAEQVILHQPLRYAEVALRDTWHYFTPGRWVQPDGDVVDYRRWSFPGPDLSGHHGQIVDGSYQPLNIFFANVGFNGAPITPRPDPSLIPALRHYQSILFTPGPMLLASLIGALLVARPAFRTRLGRQPARRAALLLALSGLLLVVAPSATTGFSYRYGLPLLVLLPPAGVIAADLGLDAALRRLRRRPPTASALSPQAPSSDSEVAAPAQPAHASPSSDIGARSIAHAADFQGTRLDP